MFADNEAFDEVFGDLKRKYGLRCILHGMSARWPSEEEKWGFWSRLVHRYCSGYTPTPVMRDLKKIVGDKDYFIITSNGERHFEMSRFVDEKVYEVEGDWLSMQCARPCHDTVYPCFEEMERMAKEETDGKIPAKLVPKCPKCGGIMKIHMDDGRAFIQDKAAQKNLQEFLKIHNGKNLVVMELGIGLRNRLIKPLLAHWTEREPNAVYIAVNKGEVYIPETICEKAVELNGDLTQILHQITKAM